MATLLGEKLRKLRQDQGYSLDRLAEVTEISKSYLWELENRDTANPTMEKVAKLAAALRVTTEFLLNSDETSPSETVADKAFFRKYQSLSAPTKQKLQDILKVLEADKKSE